MNPAGDPAGYRQKNFQGGNLMQLPKLAGRHSAEEKSTFSIGNTVVGEDFLLIAGPCSVESEEQIFAIARAVQKAGANLLRGGAYKPRTSPYSFQGLGKTGLSLLKAAADEVQLPVITEIMDTRSIEETCLYADVLQIGARNMQNYPLLIEAAKSGKPILLKRGMYATLEEWLNSAEYILKENNPRVILCERGIRTFDTYTRNTLDLSSVAALKELTHLPVIADPSHATGKAALVPAMSLAAVMAGCDGLEIEVHNCPEKALSDAEQQLTLPQFSALADDIRAARSLYTRLTTR